MTVTISDDDHDVVNPVPIEPCLCKTFRNLLLDVFEEGAEVAWAGKRRVENALLVGLEHLHSAFTAGVVLAIQIPKPTHRVFVFLFEVVGNAAETVDVEATLEGVLAHDVADLEDGPLILIHLSILELSVQRSGVFYLEIAQREVDCDRDVHLPAMFQILQQTWSHVHLELVELYRAFGLALFVLELEYSAGQHLDASRRGLDLAVDLVSARINVVFNGNADGQLFIVVAKFCHEESCWLPPGFDLIVRCRRPEHFDHVLSVLVLAGSLNL